MIQGAIFCIDYNVYPLNYLFIIFLLTADVTFFRKRVACSIKTVEYIKKFDLKALVDTIFLIEFCNLYFQTLTAEVRIMFKSKLVYVLCCVTFFIHHAVQGMSSLPKDVLLIIFQHSVFDLIDHEDDVNKSFRNQLILDQNRSNFLKVVEWKKERNNYNVDLPKEQIKQNNKKVVYFINSCLKNIQNCVSFSLVNKNFYAILASVLVDGKDQFCWLSKIFKDDLDCHMTLAVELSRRDCMPFNVMINNIRGLCFYSENRKLVEDIGNYTDAWKTMVPKYLYEALNIPDHVAQIMAKGYAAPPHQEYYCRPLFWMLDHALECTNNNLHVTSDKMFNIVPQLIHSRLNISICDSYYDLEKKEYNYIIERLSEKGNKKQIDSSSEVNISNQKSDKNNGLSHNSGFFIKRDSDQTCIIS